LSKGGILNPSGLDKRGVTQHKVQTGSVVNFGGAKHVSNEQLLELEVDILIPSALENVITGANASRVKAKVVAELANGPTTPEADAILHKRGCFVIPDFLCNAGGVTVSYFEQVQNAAYDRWKIEYVHERLDEAMTAAFDSVYEMRCKMDVHTRLAAYLVSVQRVAEACRLRGWATK
jgi:glutamate dehydrogenase (NAD(P)+)